MCCVLRAIRTQNLTLQSNKIISARVYNLAVFTGTFRFAFFSFFFSSFSSSSSSSSSGLCRGYKCLRPKRCPMPRCFHYFLILLLLVPLLLLLAEMMLSCFSCQGITLTQCLSHHCYLVSCWRKYNLQWLLCDKLCQRNYMRLVRWAVEWGGWPDERKYHNGYLELFSCACLLDNWWCFWCWCSWLSSALSSLLLLTHSLTLHRRFKWLFMSTSGFFKVSLNHSIAGIFASVDTIYCRKRSPVWASRKKRRPRKQGEMNRMKATVTPDKRERENILCHSFASLCVRWPRWLVTVLLCLCNTDVKRKERRAHSWDCDIRLLPFLFSLLSLYSRLSISFRQLVLVRGYFLRPCKQPPPLAAV